jgi:hypothetical protein
MRQVLNLRGSVLYDSDVSLLAQPASWLNDYCINFCFRCAVLCYAMLSAAVCNAAPHV